jgi:hypothetical protein
MSKLDDYRYGHLMSDRDVLPHAFRRDRDGRVGVQQWDREEEHDVPSWTTVSRRGIKLTIHPMIRYGETVTLEQYRRWINNTTNERNNNGSGQHPG